MRKIAHVDMDAFYASVEQRDDPSLRGKPVVVGGPPNSRGVVCAASYEARKYGIRSAIPCSRAARLCPEAIFVKPDFTKYREASRQIREIFLRHTPLVEPLSLDEAYLDLTEELTGIATATESAKKIRAEIFEETRLTASAGVAPNKFLAKIASDWRKPDGLFVIKPHHVDAFLEPLPVGKIPGVGKVTEASLRANGITTMGELRVYDMPQLTQWYGRFGQRLWELARGIDDRPVESSQERKSLSAEDTFERDLTLEELDVELMALSERVWNALAKRSLQGRTVTVKLRDARFNTETRRLTAEGMLRDSDHLLEITRELLTRFSFAAGSRFRLLGVGVSNFDRPAVMTVAESALSLWD